VTRANEETTMTQVPVHSKPESSTREQTRPGRTYVPNVDIVETDEGLHLWADMPGVDENSVDVRLEDDVLSIEGRVSLEEYQNLTPVYTEYNVGNYSRSFRLSDRFELARIRARVSNGVLELELPKAAEARPRRIPVTGS
jgi:HSP20 family molecular chaperone IbpA